jgi:hypothetical protein
MGERCEKRGSIVIVAFSTATVFSLMLIVTLVSVYCMRRKYCKKTSSNTAYTSMENLLSLLFGFSKLINETIWRRIRTFYIYFLILFCFPHEDNWFETMIWVYYFHYKLMALKFGVHEGFLGEFIMLLELYINYIWLCTFGGGGACKWSQTTRKTKLVLPTSSHLPGKEERRWLTNVFFLNVL